MIEIQHLSYAYPTEEGEVAENVVKDITLNIKDGEFTAVLGHNGSGKSTLAKTLNAILLPTDGDVTVYGMNTNDEEKTFDIRKTVGMVFQNPDNQIVATLVLEDVAFALENLGVEPKEMLERAENALKAVDMYDYRNHAVHKLSGGQKQRVAIAGVIAMRPKCIVLDEPTAMLDPKGRREVMSTLRKLNADFGITIILITHFMDEATQANRVIVMDKGKILLDDTHREILSQVDLLKSVGLSVPQVTDFAHQLNLPGKIITENEHVDALTALLIHNS
jgi:energy-coupling factor transport system ATP-binding protein